MLECSRQYIENDDVLAGCSVSCCPRCGWAGGFKYHARRRRKFLVIVERFVRQIVSCLTRWRCPQCGGTFTVYPSFAVPRKQYVQPVMLECSRQYIENDDANYRRASTVRGMGIHYEAEKPGTIDDRRLSHTTLHRWIGWLSKLRKTVRHALILIRAKSPTFGIYRRYVPVPVYKHRRIGRRQELQECWRLWAVETEFQALFETSVFTGLAPRCGWR